MKIGDRVKIRASRNTISELWDVVGTIVKERFIDKSITREYYDRTLEQCSDEMLYTMSFDFPLECESINLNGYKGLLIYESDVEALS